MIRKRGLAPPDCPICGRPSTRHCRQPGCILFECLSCDIWGGRVTDWHPRSKRGSRAS